LAFYLLYGVHSDCSAYKEVRLPRLLSFTCSPGHLFTCSPPSPAAVGQAGSFDEASFGKKLLPQNACRAISR